MFLQCNKNAIYVLNTSYRYGVSSIKETSTYTVNTTYTER